MAGDSWQTLGVRLMKLHRVRAALLIALSAVAMTDTERAAPAAVVLKRRDHGATGHHSVHGPQNPQLPAPPVEEMPAGRGLSWELALPTHAVLRSQAWRRPS